MTEETKAAAAEAASENSAPTPTDTAEAKPAAKADKAETAEKSDTAAEKSEKTDKAEKKPAKKPASKTGKKDGKPSGKPDAKKGGGKTIKKVKYVNPFSYDDELQIKLVNCIMKNGKKALAQKILRMTFDEMNRKGDPDVAKSFELAIQNTTPTMEVKPKRIGGGVYQIPMEVKPKRQRSLCIRWILEGARKRKGIPMYKRLAQELMDASQDLGYAANKKKEAHRMAQANKAFAHLARY